MSSTRSSLEQNLYDIVLEHLAKLAEYVPGPIKNAGGTRDLLVQRYQSDPVYSIFGLDSPEYLGATLAGGTVTSIHLFCNQSNPGIVARYQSVWVLKQGMQSYEMIGDLSGFDFYDFLLRNRDAFRKPVLALLRGLSP